MAYSNWGAFVFRNGERQRDKEDVPVFGDADVESVPSAHRIWVNLIKADDVGQQLRSYERCQHAVLGSGRVRLCGYKSYAKLFVARDDGAVDEIDIAEYRIRQEHACRWLGLAR